MPPSIDITGQRFGRLTAVEVRKDASQRRKWLCVCDCGAEVLVEAGILRYGGSRSCGCLRNDATVERSTKHGEARRGRRTQEHVIWSGMLQRCHDPRSDSYHLYGARGIAVCDEWRESFAAFKRDMGVRPGPGYSLERIDNNQGYSPSNCKWATAKEQANNRRVRRGGDQ